MEQFSHIISSLSREPTKLCCRLPDSLLGATTYDPQTRMTSRRSGIAGINRPFLRSRTHNFPGTIGDDLQVLVRCGGEAEGDMCRMGRLVGEFMESDEHVFPDSGEWLRGWIGRQRGSVTESGEGHEWDK